MKNHIKSILLLILMSAIAFACASTDPATRYAREHSGREFKSWDHENKKDKKADRRKVKDASKNKHTW